MNEEGKGKILMYLFTRKLGASSIILIDLAKHWAILFHPKDALSPSVGF